MGAVTFLHETEREYVYPAHRNSLVFKIKCTRCAGLKWELVYWDRFYEDEVMHKKLRHFTRDSQLDSYICEITQAEPVRYLKYFFKASDENGIIYFGPYGESLSKPNRCFEYLYTNDYDVLKTPEWAKGSVVYQIFPERFFNGDTSNDPEAALNWNALPTRSNFFGGDIAGIIEKLDYLESSANRQHLSQSDLQFAFKP